MIRFRERRRARHLLTGLVRCGSCGGGFATIGHDYLACSNARKLGTCEARTGIRGAALEQCALNLVRVQLMQPAAVKAFMATYHQKINGGRDVEAARRQIQETQLKQVAGKLVELYDAIDDGLTPPVKNGRITLGR